MYIIFSLIIDFIEYLSSADVMLRYDSEVWVILITEINSFLKSNWEEILGLCNP